MTLSLSISYLFFVEVTWTVYLCSFLVEGGWENAQRVWFRALLNSNSLISKLFVLWRSILRKRVPYADLNPYVLNHSLRNIYFLQVTIINRSFFLYIILNRDSLTVVGVSCIWYCNLLGLSVSQYAFSYVIPKVK